MPTFTLHGYSVDFLLDEPTFQAATLTFEFAEGAGFLSYDYVFAEDTGITLATTTTLDRVLLNGVNITTAFLDSLDSNDIHVGALQWTGEARSVTLDLEFQIGDGGTTYIMVLDGVDLPDMAVGGFGLFEELLDVLTFDEVPQLPADAPFGPGSASAYEVFFGQDFASNSETGASRGERMSGGAGIDFLAALGGRDRLYGKGGDDILLAGKGNDTAWGGAGDDVLTGFLGDDILDGGAGSDRLIGGVGADVLSGRTGADTFVFGAWSDSGPDRITDFGRGDRLAFSDGMWSGDLTARQVVTRFAEVTAEGVMFDFPALPGPPIAPEAVLLEGLQSLSGLWRRIDILDREIDF